MNKILKKYSLVIFYSLVLLFGIVFSYFIRQTSSYNDLIIFICLTMMFFALMLLWHSTNINTNIHFKRLISIECLAIACVIFYFVFYESYFIRMSSFAIGCTAVMFLSFEFNQYQNYLLGTSKYTIHLDRFISFMTVFICVCLFINLHHPIIFKYVDGEIIFLKNAYLLTIYAYIINIIFFIRVIKSNKSKREKFVLLSFIVFPLLLDLTMIIFTPINLLSDMEIIALRVSETISLYIVYFNIHVDEQKKNMEMKEALISSQVGPHFLYNSLATISSIAEKEGSLKASEAINKFADYLRMNIDSVKDNRLVPFTKELEHIEAYLWLEQIRFGEDLNVVYDIHVQDFMLPPLTIQPLVENAVSHGVLEKEGGGTVKIATELIDNKIVISVEDDGVGFIYDENEHFGIYNIKERIKTICDGKVIIESQIGKGTKASVIL